MLAPLLLRLINHSETVLIKSLLVILALASYWLALTSRMNSFPLFYIFPWGLWPTDKLTPDSSCLSPLVATWHLTDFVYSLSLSFPAWLYSAKSLAKISFFIHQPIKAAHNKRTTHTFIHLSGTSSSRPFCPINFTCKCSLQWVIDLVKDSGFWYIIDTGPSLKLLLVILLLS